MKIERINLITWACLSNKSWRGPSRQSDLDNRDYFYVDIFMGTIDYFFRESCVSISCVSAYGVFFELEFLLDCLMAGDGEYRYARIPSSTAIFVCVDGGVVGLAGVDGIHENSYAELREKAAFYWCDREQFLSEVVKTLSENSELVRNLNPDGSTYIDRLEVLAETAVSAVRG